MKKQLFIMESESGFFLPYVLFITALIFIIIATSINTYQQDIQITHRLVEQLRIETIVQMGLAKFNQEHLPNEEARIDVSYNFRDGEVTIVYSLINDFEYRLHFTVLAKSGLEYTTSHTVKINK